MSKNWYTRVCQDISEIPDFIEFYEQELNDAKRETSISGNLEKNLSMLPGITENRFNQLQEIEAVLAFLNIQLAKIRRKYFQKYLEGYNRALTAREAEKYVDGEDEVVIYETLINDVAFIRNKWLGVIKGLESKNFQLGHITRLRVAGMEDASI